MYEAKPTVKAGRRICHAITQTNCSRDRNSGSESMLSPRFPWQVCSLLLASSPCRSLGINQPVPLPFRAVLSQACVSVRR